VVLGPSLSELVRRCHGIELRKPSQLRHWLGLRPYWPSTLLGIPLLFFAQQRQLSERGQRSQLGVALAPSLSELVLRHYGIALRKPSQ